MFLKSIRKVLLLIDSSFISLKFKRSIFLGPQFGIVQKFREKLRGTLVVLLSHKKFPTAEVFDNFFATWIRNRTKQNFHDMNVFEHFLYSGPILIVFFYYSYEPIKLNKWKFSDIFLLILSQQTIFKYRTVFEPFWNLNSIW